MKYFIFILFVIVLNGEASVYPFDMNKQQYLSLSNKEKLRSWEKYATVNDALYHHKNQYEPNNKVYDLYKTMQNKITVTITKGHFRYMKKGYYIPPFELVKYEVKRVRVYSLKNNNFHHFIWVSYQDIGLYIGIKPHKQYEIVDKYISKQSDYFNKLTYAYKPAVIVKSNRWKKGVHKKVSFKGTYNATDLNVKINLKSKKRKGTHL